VSLLFATAAAAGCGTTPMAARPAPPIPIDLSIYVDSRAVSVSPAVLGAGPVRLLIASQAPQPLVLQLVRRGRSLLGRGRTLIAAQSPPIAAGGNRQLSVNLRPGVYTLTTRGLGLSDAALALPSAIAPARLLVGAPRPSSGNALLQP
jgi:hypothetical protein